MRRIAFIGMYLLVSMAASAFAAADGISVLAESTASYFRPYYGTVLRAEGQRVFISQPQDEKDRLRPGMRLRVMRVGEPFRHPVTKEVLGKVEAPVGRVEVREPGTDSVPAAVIEGEAREGDSIRLSDTRIRMMFCQDKGIDWYLADDFYRKLKATGRIEMLDTQLETADEARVLEEARRLGAEVALVLTARTDDKATMLRERLYWVSDGAKFVDTEINVGADVSKDLKLGESFFIPRTGEAVMTFDLRFGARLIASGDFDGDGNQEFVISTGKDLRVYALETDLKPLWEIKGSAVVDHLWLDTIDLNRNGRDEVVITYMWNSEIETSIYEFSGEGFKPLWKGKYFVRRLGDGLIAQSFSNSDGFGKDIVQLLWQGDYRTGDKIRTPKGVNIYDFVNVEGTGNEPLVFAYDEKGFMNLYDENGTRVWKSSSDNGGFISTFKKPSTVAYLDAGEWSIKDRLIRKHREVMVVYRTPLTSMVKTAGYKSSLIKTYWWNGVSMDEAVTVEGVQGSIQDYAVAGDKIVVLSNPFLGVKFDNILKGENPLGSILTVYSAKGR